MAYRSSRLGGLDAGPTTRGSNSTSQRSGRFTGCVGRKTPFSKTAWTVFGIGDCSCRPLSTGKRTDRADLSELYQAKGHADLVARTICCDCRSTDAADARDVVIVV